MRGLIFIDSGIPGFGLEQAMDTAHGGAWHFGFFAAPEFPEMLTRDREREFLTAFAYQGKFVHDKSAFTEADITEYVRHHTKPGGMAAGFGYYRAFEQDAKDNKVIFEKAKLSVPAWWRVSGRRMPNAENVSLPRWYQASVGLVNKVISIWRRR